MLFEGLKGGQDGTINLLNVFAIEAVLRTGDFENMETIARYKVDNFVSLDLGPLNNKNTVMDCPAFASIRTLLFKTSP